MSVFPVDFLLLGVGNYEEIVAMQFSGGLCKGVEFPFPCLVGGQCLLPFAALMWELEWKRGGNIEDVHCPGPGPIKGVDSVSGI